MRIICLDFGTVRIGLSVSDPTNTFSVSLPTINNDKNALAIIKKLANEYNTTSILIGYPLNLSGDRTSLCDEIDKFVKSLNFNNEYEIIKRDERFSSKIAESQIIESVTSKKRRRDKSLIDKFSSANILQEYLNYKKIQEKNETDIN